jgi:hypothetical protein
MKVARYLVFAGFMLLGLWFLNHAAYSSWASWGPPTKYPKAWEHRALVSLCISIVFFSSAIMALIGLRKAFDWKKTKLKYVWVILVIFGLSYPHVREWLLIDKCLDNGGSWDAIHFTCKK